MANLKQKITIELDAKAIEDKAQWVRFVRSAGPGELGIYYWGGISVIRGRHYVTESDTKSRWEITPGRAGDAWDLMAREYGIRWSSNCGFVDATRYDEAIQRAMFGERRYA